METNTLLLVRIISKCRIGHMMNIGLTQVLIQLHIVVLSSDLALAISPSTEITKTSMTLANTALLSEEILPPCTPKRITKSFSDSQKVNRCGLV